MPGAGPPPLQQRERVRPRPPQTPLQPCRSGAARLRHHATSPLRRSRRRCCWAGRRARRRPVDGACRQRTCSACRCHAGAWAWQPPLGARGSAAGFRRRAALLSCAQGSPRTLAAASPLCPFPRLTAPSACARSGPAGGGFPSQCAAPPCGAPSSSWTPWAPPLPGQSCQPRQNCPASGSERRRAAPRPSTPWRRPHSCRGQQSVPSASAAACFRARLPSSARAAPCGAWHS
mmetsp:Transcript_19116/g.73082  ORF Transcript_19116/g.73082 Transcript_19116/m.73082 type:complete len:232 (-) Transcript_19116:168-863(-)